MLQINKNSPNAVISAKETAMLISIFIGIDVANDMAQILNETKQAISHKKDRLIKIGLIEDTSKLQISQAGRKIVAKLIAQLNYEVLVESFSQSPNVA
jgi:hypothetical protein